MIERNELIKMLAANAKELFEEIVGEDIEQKNYDITLHPSKMNGYGLVLGFIEDFKGTLVMNVTKKVAYSLTSKMNCMDINQIEDADERDELVEASIGEVINMLGGKTITAFDQHGVKCNITTPTIMYGENMRLINRGNIIYKIDYKFNSSCIDLYVTLRKNKNK